MSNTAVTLEYKAPEETKLQANALGLISMAALTAAYMGPALSVYAMFGPLYDKVGEGVGFVMIVALGLTLLSAISFGMMAKVMPSAGGLFSWTGAAIGPSTGLFMGITTVLYLAISLIFPPIIFAQFVNEMIGQFNEIFGLHMPVNMWTFFAGEMAMIVIAAAVVYRGIAVSSHLALALLLVELAVIMALAITFVGFAVRHGTFTLKPVTFAACTGGWRGIALALPMGLMCMVCDAAVPAAEETRNAKWTIPVAVVLTCAIIGIWYIFGMSAFAMAYTAQPASASAIQNDIAPIVKHNWGNARFLVSLTAMTASLGAFIPIMIGSSRMIFAMARQQKLPKWMGFLKPGFKAPWNALNLLFIFTILGAVIPVYLYGTDPTINWWANTLGWYIAIVYLAVNLVNIVYYWRFARDKFNPIFNLAIPLIAIVVQLAFIWKTVIVELWKGGSQGRSAQGFIVLASVVSIGYVVWVRARSGAAPERDYSTIPAPEEAA